MDGNNKSVSYYIVVMFKYCYVEYWSNCEQNKIWIKWLNYWNLYTKWFVLDLLII